jgi:NAD(P)-dependent dehydrogenase (short-subunit alcohol dehydrogenase family)
MAQQRVLVTAGANGIGLAIAGAFARAGARVHVCDIDADAVDRARASHDAVSATVSDVSDPAAVERMFADVQRELGGLDVLVNNAGIAGPTAPVAEYDFSGWQEVIGVNLNGTFLVTQRAIPLLRESGQASIIIMSSLAGRYGYPNRAGYATTKWGLVGFAKTLSLELGPFGITCNAIHPGAVEGARVRNVLEARARLSGRSQEQETELALANQAIKKFVDPADIAELIMFLAGPHGRSISGQSIPIDGDSKSAQ